MTPRGRFLILISCLCAFLAGEQVFADGLEDLKKLIGDFNVQIKHTTTVSEGKTNVPPMQSDLWSFGGIGGITIRYSHYLNQPPHYTGQYPSLAGGDMGLGFGDGAFYNWYGGNAIRVLINGVDILAQKFAKRIEAKEGLNGSLRMVWDLDKGGELVLNFTVPEDGHAIYARVDLVPGELSVNGIQVQLYCYPGGFGPGYKLPSHRWITTAKGEWDISEDFKAGVGNPYPEAPFDKGEDWVFYADKLQTSGSLGLLVEKEESPSGKIRMSSYGQTTELNYPANTRQMHLAFYAFETENLSSRKRFMSSLDRERAMLTSIHSAPGASHSSPARP